MSTLHRIREIALVAALGAGVFAGSATLACEEPAGRQASIALFADLGQMTVEASRDAAVAHLGSMTVTATRLPDADVQFADLGAMTVTAPRTDLRVADLGGLTVEATRIKTVVVAARPTKRNFN
jgi:hypothetical protein